LFASRDFAYEKYKGAFAACKHGISCMFEHHHEKLLPRRLFIRRVAKYAGISLSIIFVSLVIGMVGYHALEGYSWVDSFLNAAMLMGGMGPVGSLHTDAGKLFAGFYALYCGLVELVAIGIFAAPLVHRFLHHFHLEKGHD
jgi:hypothetical protein